MILVWPQQEKVIKAINTANIADAIIYNKNYNFLEAKIGLEAESLDLIRVRCEYIINHRDFNEEEQSRVESYLLSMNYWLSASYCGNYISDLCALDQEVQEMHNNTKDLAGDDCNII